MSVIGKRWAQRHSPGLLDHVLRQSALAGSAQLMGVVLRLALAVLAARLLGPFALGLYVLALTLANGATVLATVGLDRGALRFVAHYRGRGERAEALGIFVFSSAVCGGVGAGAAILLFFGAHDLAGWAHRPELASVARVIAIAVPFAALGQISRDGLRGFEDVRLPVVLEQLATPVATAMVLVIVHLARPGDTRAAVIAVAVAQGALGLVSWVALAVRVGRGRLTPVFQPSEWLRFSVPLWAERGMLFLIAATGPLLVARFRGTDSVAVYGVALRVAGLVGLPLAAVSTIFGPTISNLAARQDWARLQAMYAELTWTLALVGGAIGAVLAAAGPLALRAFGPRFAGGYAALIVLIASQIVNSATGPSGLVLVMTGRTGWRLANATAGVVLTLALSAVLVPKWGGLGAAVAVAIASSLLNVAQIYQVRHLVGLWAYARDRG